MPSQKAFTRTEALFATAAVLLIATVAIVLLREPNRRNQLAQCQSILHAHGVAAANYATDFRDAIVSLSWRAGMPVDGLGDPPARTDLEAAAAQVRTLISGRAGVDIGPTESWLPNIGYTLLVLSEYNADQFPSSLNACPADAPRQWRRVPLSADERGRSKDDFHLLPPEPPTTAAPARWVFSSSYQPAPASYSPDARTDSGPTISQGATDGEYLLPLIRPFGEHQRRQSEVAFPGSKVSIFDSHDRHFARSPLFYAHPEARQPLLFFDASVRVHAARDTDPGFRPNDPSHPGPTIFTYSPHADTARWNPPPRTPGGDPDLRGHFRWTRGGLAGADVRTPPPPARTTTAPAPPLHAPHPDLTPAEP